LFEASRVEAHRKRAEDPLGYGGLYSNYHPAKTIFFYQSPHDEVPHQLYNLEMIFYEYIRM